MYVQRTREQSKQVFIRPANEICNKRASRPILKSYSFLNDLKTFSKKKNIGFKITLKTQRVLNKHLILKDLISQMPYQSYLKVHCGSVEMWSSIILYLRNSSVSEGTEIPLLMGGANVFHIIIYKKCLSLLIITHNWVRCNFGIV